MLQIQEDHGASADAADAAAQRARAGGELLRSGDGQRGRLRRRIPHPQGGRSGTLRRGHRHRNQGRGCPDPLRRLHDVHEAQRTGCREGLRHRRHRADSGPRVPEPGHLQPEPCAEAGHFGLHTGHLRRLGDDREGRQRGLHLPVLPEERRFRQLRNRIRSLPARRRQFQQYRRSGRFRFRRERQRLRDHRDRGGRGQKRHAARVRQRQHLRKEAGHPEGRTGRHRARLHRRLGLHQPERQVRLLRAEGPAEEDRRRG